MQFQITPLPVNVIFFTVEVKGYNFTQNTVTDVIYYDLCQTEITEVTTRPMASHFTIYYAK